MTADVFSASHALNNMNLPIGDRRPSDRNGLSLFSLNSDPAPNPDNKVQYHAIVLRKLPSNTNQDSVNSMLLFAKDLVDCELVSPSRQPDDQGFVTAVAYFRTREGAKEARERLNGKRNPSNDASMIVDLLTDGPPGPIGSRRNTVDSPSARQGSVSTASTIATNGRQSSRYNGTFQQNLERMSPPNNATPALGNGDYSVPGLFSATSPVAPSFAARNLGKSVINDEADDDDGLLNETVGFATQQPVQSLPRRTTNPSIASRFSNLSLNTNGVSQNGVAHNGATQNGGNQNGVHNGVNHMSSPPVSAYASPLSAAAMQSPGTSLSSAMSPQTLPSHLNGHVPSAAYQQYPPHYSARPNYPPPANPADQNPPCNTLYVGNLPVDTSEDELKQMFSKQRGYKRLCFRTKQNGPMCFVEFEDVSFATKALNELYGHMLHNSVKGGIRLSFSKNPLGVRSGQSGNIGSASAITPSTPLPGYGAGVPPPPGFPSATGPPPGLSAPPGLSTPVYTNGSSGFGVYSNGGFGYGPGDLGGSIRPPPSSSANGSANGFGPIGYPPYGSGR